MFLIRAAKRIHCCMYVFCCRIRNRWSSGNPLRQTYVISAKSECTSLSVILCVAFYFTETVYDVTTAGRCCVSAAMTARRSTTDRVITSVFFFHLKCKCFILFMISRLWVLGASDSVLLLTSARLTSYYIIIIIYGSTFYHSVFWFLSAVIRQCILSIHTVSNVCIVKKLHSQHYQVRD